MEAKPVTDAARRTFGLNVTVIRLLSSVRFPGGPVTYLVDAPEIDPRQLSPWPGVLGDDPNRALFADRRGVRSLLQWAHEQLNLLGMPVEGEPVQIRSWNLAATWQITTAAGAVWLKATPDFLAHESAILDALGKRHSGVAPRLLAGQPGRALMAHVDGVDGYELEPEQFLVAVDLLRSVQDDVVVEDLLAAGVPSFGSHQLSSGMEDLLERHGQELNHDDRARLDALIGEVADRFGVASAVPSTLCHGDFHGGNIRFGSDKSVAPVILDWGDSFVGNPLFDLVVLESQYKEWPTWVRERWLTTWDSRVEGVAECWNALRPLAGMKLALTYRMFCDRIEAAELNYHLPDIVPAIQRGLIHTD